MVVTISGGNPQSVHFAGVNGPEQELADTIRAVHGGAGG